MSHQEGYKDLRLKIRLSNLTTCMLQKQGHCFDLSYRWDQYA